MSILLTHRNEVLPFSKGETSRQKGFTSLRGKTLKGFLLTSLFLFVSILAYSQEARLAQEYYNNGEFEKAAVLYEKLSKSGKNDFYFNRYVESVSYTHLTLPTTPYV